ncbi:MAG TPA: type II toxin-antitoxin system VapC family toxin [Thermoanaerobaculia bacterium]
MIAYIDASVLMRIVLRQPEPLKEWNALERGVASALLTVEGYRTIDQLWHRNELTEAELAEKRSRFQTFLPRLDIRPLTETVLEAASLPLPTSLATLDAIHLATAILYRVSQPPDERPIVFATHDVQLARAARAMHFEVIGA